MVSGGDRPALHTRMANRKIDFRVKWAREINFVGADIIRPQIAAMLPCDADSIYYEIKKRRLYIWGKFLF